EEGTSAGADAATAASKSAAPDNRLLYAAFDLNFLIPTSTNALLLQNAAQHTRNRGENYPLLGKSIAANFSERTQGDIEADAAFHLAVVAGLGEGHRVDKAFVAIAEAERVVH